MWSITLRSADGYSRAYQVARPTIVDATVKGSAATAARIFDLTLLQHSIHGSFSPAPGNFNGTVHNSWRKASAGGRSSMTG